MHSSSWIVMQRRQLFPSQLAARHCTTIAQTWVPWEGNLRIKSCILRQRHYWHYPWRFFSEERSGCHRLWQQRTGVRSKNRNLTNGNSVTTYNTLHCLAKTATNKTKSNILEVNGYKTRSAGSANIKNITFSPSAGKKTLPAR
jgi:hypothetical protein